MLMILLNAYVMLYYENFILIVYNLYDIIKQHEYLTQSSD